MIVKYRSVEHQIPLIAVGLRETKELAFKRHFKVCLTNIHKFINRIIIVSFYHGVTLGESLCEIEVLSKSLLRYST